MNPTLVEYWQRHGALWTGALADRLGLYQDIEASSYEQTQSGLDAYLAAAGVRYVSAQEATTPHQRWPRPLLPPQYAWVGIALLGRVHGALREHVGLPIKVRNWWRPPEYNEVAKGAARSDHLWACAVDLDFTGGWLRAVAARRAAQKLVVKLLPMNLLSLGVGWTTLHVGYAAPETLRLGCHRRWKYGKLPIAEKTI